MLDPSINTSTVLFASAVPVNVSVLSFVTPSVTPESVEIDTTLGAPGAVVSITNSELVVSLVALPAVSVTVAVTL